MIKALILTLLISSDAAADTFVCDVKNLSSDILIVKVNESDSETESMIRHWVEPSTGTHVETVLYKQLPAVRAGIEVSYCNNDKNEYWASSKTYETSSLCASKIDESPVSFSSSFNEKKGGRVNVKTLNSYYSIKFTSCRKL